MWPAVYTRGVINKAGSLYRGVTNKAGSRGVINKAGSRGVINKAGSRGVINKAGSLYSLYQRRHKQGRQSIQSVPEAS